MQRPGRTTWRALAILALLAADPTAAGAQDEDNELDRFMERVLEQRERNAAARLQYVLDEQSQLRFTGPGGVALWGFRGEYTWYERDGFFVRSPVRIDGVTIDEARRREYEAEWLQREQRRRERRRDERRSPTRTSVRSIRDNVELAIGRLWGARIDGELLDAIAEQARTWGDDHAAITAAADRILEAAGGVPAVGFDRAVARARDGFSLLESGRLLPDEVTGMLDRTIGQLAPAAPAATEEAFASFLELFDLAVRFELPLAAVDTAPAEIHADPEVARLRAAALAERRGALSAAVTAAAAAGQGTRETPSADPVWGNMEPRFVSDAYFLDFEFEPGNYYLVGRETLDGTDVLRIEYYPERMFADGDDADRDADRDPDRRGNDDEAADMDRTSLVTLWIDRLQHQIVRYTFDNLGFDFLPGRWLFRLDDLTASMTMRQPFPGVWLPARIDMRAALSLATGTYEATATRTYTNYREAETGGRVRAGGEHLSR